MQRLRTHGTLLFIFGAILVFIAAPVESLKVDERVNSLEKAFHIRDITTKAADDDKKALITYQQINRKPISDANDEDVRIYEINLGDTGGQTGEALLIATPFQEACRENSSLPSWKIDKSVGNFLVKINHAKEFAGKTFFLCLGDVASGSFKHFGDESKFSIG
jgi:hypothetical protein